MTSKNITLYTKPQNMEAGEFEEVHETILKTFERDIHGDYTQDTNIRELHQLTSRINYEGQLDHINPYILGQQSRQQQDEKAHHDDYEPTDYFVTGSNDTHKYLEDFYELFKAGWFDRAALLETLTHQSLTKQFKTDIQRLKIKTGDVLFFLESDKVKANPSDISTSDWKKVQVAYITRTQDAACLLSLDENDEEEHIFIAGNKGTFGVFTYDIHPDSNVIKGHFGFSKKT